mmetsp:Transcript_114090/g.221593  ORF Transcript_114090/g.221593 Transcript_114090/m.221593 type:complete len:318 (+) Transcript_114090:745-1698(+)
MRPLTWSGVHASDAMTAINQQSPTAPCMTSFMSILFRKSLASGAKSVILFQLSGPLCSKPSPRAASPSSPPPSPMIEACPAGNSTSTNLPPASSHLALIASTTATPSLTQTCSFERAAAATPSSLKRSHGAPFRSGSMISATQSHSTAGSGGGGKGASPWTTRSQMDTQPPSAGLNCNLSAQTFSTGASHWTKVTERLSGAGEAVTTATVPSSKVSPPSATRLPDSTMDASLPSSKVAVIVKSPTLVYSPQTRKSSVTLAGFRNFSTTSCMVSPSFPIHFLPSHPLPVIMSAGPHHSSRLVSHEICFPIAMFPSFLI